MRHLHYSEAGERTRWESKPVQSSESCHQREGLTYESQAGRDHSQIWEITPILSQDQQALDRDVRLELTTRGGKVAARKPEVFNEQMNIDEGVVGEPEGLSRRDKPERVFRIRVDLPSKVIFEFNGT